MTLTWNANTETDLAGYNVYRSASATGPFTKLNTAVLTTPRYQDTTAPAVTTSFYQVQAVDELGTPRPRLNSGDSRDRLPKRHRHDGRVGTSITLNKPSGTASGESVAAMRSAGRPP